MIGKHDAMATVAVSNLATAKLFYENLLGLKQFGAESPGVATFRSGNSTIVVYESAFAGTNRATSATWGVADELEAIVQALKDADVVFEHYDLPGAHHDGDVHVFGSFKAVWFKDPDGNILHLNNG